jgi:hypothetical protein
MQTISKRIHKDSKFKAAYEQSRIRASYSNQLDPPVFICREVFHTIPEVFYTKKDFYLLDELNRRIEMLKTSGLIDLWSFKKINKNLNVKEQSQVKVLKLKQLMGIFCLLLIGQALSCLLFCWEILMKKV